MRTRITLRISSSQVSVERTRRGVVERAEGAAYNGLDELSSCVAGLLAEPGRRSGRRLVDIALEPPIVQVRALSGLPPVNGVALASLIALQPGRYFRKNGKPLVTDAAWVGRPKAGTAFAAAVEEPWLDAIASGLREARLEPGWFSPAASPVRLRLLSTVERARNRRRARLGLRRIAAFALTAWVGTAAVAIGRLLHERAQVEREIVRLREPVAAAMDARRIVGEARRAIEAVNATRETRGITISRLAAIVAALPDDAHLTSVQWGAAGGGLVSGSAREAASFVAALERSGFVAPRLDRPSRRETVSNGQREPFTLRFGRGIQ